MYVTVSYNHEDDSLEIPYKKKLLVMNCQLMKKHTNYVIHSFSMTSL